MDPPRPYVVRGTARNGTVTYNCPTASWAERKYRDFVAKELSAVTVTDPDGRLLTEADLEAQVAGVDAVMPGTLVPQI